MSYRDAEKIMKASGKVITDSNVIMELAVLLDRYVSNNKE